MNPRARCRFAGVTHGHEVVLPPLGTLPAANATLPVPSPPRMPCLHMRLHEAPVSQRARSPKSRAHRHPHGVQASTACSSTACGLITPSTPRPLSRRRLPRPPLGFSLHAPQTYTSRASHALNRWTRLKRRGNPYRAFYEYLGQSLGSRTALHSHPLRSPSPALQPVAHAAGQPLHSHPLSSRPLNLMFFHAHRGPPSSPRATSSTTTSIGGRVAPTSCSHSHAALFRLTSGYVDGGVSDRVVSPWFHHPKRPISEK